MGNPPPGGFTGTPDSSSLGPRHDPNRSPPSLFPRGGGGDRALSGERDLARLLAGLAPALDEVPYVFAAHGDAPIDTELMRTAVGIVREREGLTLVLPADVARERRFADGPIWARIELTVHSDLEAVGMMASVATALAAEGISCNPLAGYYHDHLFVPWPRREDAIRILELLAHRP